jgi:flagellar basal-body rod modification protein FlgD
MASAPSNVLGGPPPTTTSGTTQSATDAFGLGFEDLLKIVLTQLTYQDPLKPMDNFEFVSQLAQFAQIQQTQDMASSLQTLVSAQGTSQAASLLGRTVEFRGGTATVSGKVTAVSFGEDGTTLSVRLPNGQTVTDISLNIITGIKETI